MAFLPTGVPRRVLGLLPPAVSGRVDLLRPSLRTPWGGPFNGQEHRLAIVRALARTVAFDVVVETGTYRGTTTEALAEIFDVPVHTVEQDERFYTYSRARLARDPRITVTRGDSRAFLRAFAQRHAGDSVFAYLDAHWEDDLPLPEELEIVAAHLPRAVVMVDDFQVPGDTGYGFDDYGPGKALTEACLPPMTGWTLCYPSVPAHRESGRQRGCCVLLSPAFAHVRIPELRVARTL